MTPSDSGLIGRDLEGYHVVSLLGEGGMGQVYLAEDRSLGRRVALKLLPERYVSDPRRLRRFIDEARAASALNHPNIITVLHIGESQGRRFIATELIDGETLRERIRRGPLPVSEALEIAVQVARALHAAHRAGIVHRDVKPDNIMIRRDGYVKVLDFGLAKLAPEELASGATPASDEDSGSTRTVGVLGTPRYMAPEQAAGVPVDARADLYSLGLVIHEMLTGRVPPKPPGATVRRVDPAVLPKELVPVVRHALEPDPAARHQTASGLLEELEALQRAHAGRPARRRLRATAAAGMAILLAAVALFVRTGLGSKGATPGVSSLTKIAVLPFNAVESGDPDQDHLTLGIADAIALRLGKLRQLTVTPTATSRHFVGTKRAPADVGRELGVQAVLTGLLLRSGDRLRVTLKLTRADDGTQIWSGRFDERFDDVVSVQDAITEQVTLALIADVDPGAIRRAQVRETSSSAAYETYLRGRERWARRTPDSIRAAITMFEQAIEQDPSFAVAYAGLADAYSLTASGLLPAERFPKAKAAALKALDLNDGLAEAHNALAFISYKWEWRWDVAEREFTRAIALQPNLVLAHHWFAELQSILGRHDAALAGFARAQQLDPYSTSIRVDRAAALARASRAAEAVALLQEGIAQDPKAAALFNGLFNALWVLGRHDDAFEALFKSRALSGAKETDLAETRATYARGGFQAVARADLTRLLEVEKTGKSAGYFSRLSIAGTIGRQYAILGDRSAALTWLEEAARRRDDGPLAIRTMWYWKPFRDEPRFQAVEKLLAMPPP